MRKLSLPLLLATALTGAVLSACSPKFDWRDYRSNDAPYAVLFPGKPATQTRKIDLAGTEVSMTMAAAEVDGITFAVGSALLADAAKAQAALPAMKTALLKNIGASVTADKVAAQSSGNGGAAAQQTTLDVEAKGTRNGESMLLIGRFVAKDKRIYQVIIMGREKHIVRETVDTFLSSFKLN
ncbi:hypothetical protein [Rugamonas rubra]|uniref:Transmembrane protein n=1 Tax=Rugamonas rubra TaxID=758825 RepID=A0A1I4RNN2_9BURK|nr:hypothetical protein [Rugamonas rubra]SFM53756.1 hypothetical protein SAMN02982985_04390 [Rugamonas rubra]